MRRESSVWERRSVAPRRTCRAGTSPLRPIAWSFHPIPASGTADWRQCSDSTAPRYSSCPRPQGRCACALATYRASAGRRKSGDLLREEESRGRHEVRRSCCPKATLPVAGSGLAPAAACGPMRKRNLESQEGSRGGLRGWLRLASRAAGDRPRHVCFGQQPVCDASTGVSCRLYSRCREVDACALDLGGRQLALGVWVWEAGDPVLAHALCERDQVLRLGLLLRRAWTIIGSGH